MIINTDASCHEDGIGIGYVIQYESGRYEGKGYFEGDYSSMEAEYVAMREAASVAVRFFDDNRHIFFKTDCQGLVDKIDKQGKYSTTTGKWKKRQMEFVELLAEHGYRTTKWSIGWIPRERNQEADDLAHLARDTSAPA